MSRIDDILATLAFGRLSKTTGDRDRFLDSITTSVYRVIVEGVPGGFGSGYSDYVLCKTKWGWQIRRYGTGVHVDGGSCYNTRADAARALVNLDLVHHRTLTRLARLAGVSS